MPEPIVFISHFRVKDGKLDAVKDLNREAVTDLHATKPQTLVWLSYFDEPTGTMTFVHLFPDAASMDRHVEGALERAKAAYQLMDPLGWEIYGSPSPTVTESMRRTADAAGVALTHHPRFMAGFLQPWDGMGPVT